MNIIKFLKRFNGHVWGPYKEFLNNPEKYGGKLKSHITSEWTSFEHFAHDNYQRGHLPQLCIVASGWKAKLLSLLVWPNPPYEPELKSYQWFKNGDHPNDDVYRPFEDTGKIPTEPREGKIVRYYRHPCIDGQSKCKKCNCIMNDHGWLDCGQNGIIICPGNWITETISGYKVSNI